MTPRRVQIVLGPPGTGKTTTLLQMMTEYLARGVNPDRIGFVSFSKRAIEEVLERLQLKPGDFPHFRTIHSTAFHMLGLKREDVMQPKQWTQFSEVIGLPLTAGGHEEPMWDGTLGDKCLALDSLARARTTNVEVEWRRAMLPDVSLRNARMVVGQYERFKYVNVLWDFHDMILQADGRLPLDVLFIDEAQDTTPAQWAFLRRVAADVPHIVIAGDDDQAVYGWSGADGDALRRFAGERIILPVSWRLPATIKALADKVVTRIQVRVPKQFAHRDGDDLGMVEWRNDLATVNLRTPEEKWLLLARSNYQLEAYRELARSQGVVYSLPDGKWSWSLPPVRAAKVYEHLRKGHQAPRAEVRYMGPYLPAPLPRELPSQVSWNDLFGETAMEMTWMEGLPGISPSDKEYIRGLRQQGESLIAPGRVRIGTVHSVKGAEANHVVLSTDISSRVAHGARLDPDAEHRVQYVGVTRAINSLTLLRPTTASHWVF